MLLDPKTGEPTRIARAHRRGRHQGTDQREERRRDSARDADSAKPSNRVATMATKDKEERRKGAPKSGAKAASKKGEAPKSRGPHAGAQHPGAAAAPARATTSQTVRAKRLTEQFGFTNPHEIPTLEKIVLNVGAGRGDQAAEAARQRGRGAGDRSPGSARCGRKAKKSIANFGLREGQEIGAVGHAARRADVGVPRPVHHGRRCRASATSAD